MVNWIFALALEIPAIVLMFCLRPISFFWSLGPKGERKGPPILLVHGYLHDSSAWIYHRWQLKRHGYSQVYLLNLKPRFASIAEYAKQIEAKASLIEKETGQNHLILIGHSMGGLVSAFYATQLAPQGKVTDVITIGSPLAGTLMAKIGIGPAAREMERNSEFLKKLQIAILSNRTIRFLSIATKTDQLVIPYTSGVIGDKCFIINNLCHVSLLYSPRVAKKIVSFLG